MTHYAILCIDPDDLSGERKVTFCAHYFDPLTVGAEVEKWQKSLDMQEDQVKRVNDDSYNPNNTPSSTKWIEAVEVTPPVEFDLDEAWDAYMSEYDIGKSAAMFPEWARKWYERCNSGE
jgi:hypothetical protein